jgi:hypothetical protein
VPHCCIDDQAYVQLGQTCAQPLYLLHLRLKWEEAGILWMDAFDLPTQQTGSFDEKTAHA